MSHVHYEEEQCFNNLRWIWFSIPMVMLIPVIIGVNDPDTNQNDRALLLISTLFALLPVIAILLFSKLLVKINQQGIQYKFIPAVFRWKLIPKEMIEFVEISDKKGFLEKWECGYRKNRASNSITMNITGNKFARINLRDGSKIKIGTENPEAIERALKKLLSPDNS